MIFHNCCQHAFMFCFEWSYGDGRKRTLGSGSGGKKAFKLSMLLILPLVSSDF